MREAFLAKRFAADSQVLIDHTNNIIGRYDSLGLTLTLRQLYYQMVQRNIIRNNLQMYSKLGDVVSNARLAGLVDWESIEDRIRQPQKVADFEDRDELLQAAINSYRLDRWQGQHNYVEMWVEKDALSGVIWPVASQYHVTLMVNRGYSSISAMYEASKRFLKARARKQEPHILYVGDHDPSGLDMDRDIIDRLQTFRVRLAGFERIALTRAQIDEHDPPPNPAKFTDSRAEAYVREHGETSWEADALPPEVLQSTLREKLELLVNRKQMNHVIAQEKRDIREIQEKFGLDVDDAEEDEDEDGEEE